MDDGSISDPELRVTISKLNRRKVQCVGPWYLYLWQGIPIGGSDDSESTEDTDSSTEFDDDNVAFLRSLEPKEWKNQDHYAVLGLGKVRFEATDEDIKKAYRRKVLQHHPDKRKAAGEEIRADDDYFTCITKAWEILGTPRTRRAFDSVDPTFDDDVPMTNEYTKRNFYKVFGRVFEMNSRWSEKQPVPELGGPDSTRQQVEKFYAFWYNFESWREFSYLDNEEKDRGQGRDERKWIEKQNKSTRSKRKKEEMARIRLIVDTSYSIDPRLAKFREDDKQRKIAIKEAKKEAARARFIEEERRVQAADEEARRIKAKQEEEEKARQNALKAERDAQKKELKNQRTALRKLVKTNNYYTEENEDEEKVNHMAWLETMCECFQTNELETLIKQLEVEGREAYLAAVKEVQRRIEEERQSVLDIPKRTSHTHGKSKGAPWTQEQLQLLIKAVNIFPAGTNQRWEVVANFINQHHSGESVIRTAKEVLSKAKDLQSVDYSKNILKVTANMKSLSNLHKEKSPVEIAASASERFDSPAEQQGLVNVMTPWKAAEQQLLEQALKTYPTNTPERWEKIANCIPTRSKKDCMRRYKDLVEMVKAKKAAQAAVAQAAGDQKAK